LIFIDIIHFAISLIDFHISFPFIILLILFHFHARHFHFISLILIIFIIIDAFRQLLIHYSPLILLTY